MAFNIAIFARKRATMNDAMTKGIKGIKFF